MRASFAFLASLAAAITLAPVVAIAGTSPTATVHQFIDGFNTGDAASALAACAPQTQIVDEFAPYEWSGNGACARWAAAYGANAKRNGVTDGIVTLAKPTTLETSGDRAYVVVPAQYRFNVRGQAMAEHGATMTFALEKHGGWRIRAWTWSKHL
jgi:hypothetical protein